MIVYAASDLHGNLPEVPSDADILLLAGDIAPDFTGYGRHRGQIDKFGLRQRDWMCADFNEWVRAFGGPVVFTWGNHDFVGEKPWLVKDILNALPDEALLLKDLTRVVGGLRIHGSPWVPGLPYWAFYASDQALDARADSLPGDLDVLMVHGPPYKHGDYIPGGTEKQVSKYGNLHGLNVGDPWLAEAIQRTRPKVTICGHIHEAYGRYDLACNPVVNCAMVDEAYAPRPQPFTRLYELEE